MSSNNRQMKGEQVPESKMLRRIRAEERLAAPLATEYENRRKS